MQQQKSLLKDLNRKQKNEIEHLRQKITSQQRTLEDFSREVKDIKESNNIREEENRQMLEEMSALERHLSVIEQQNRELENELDNFMACDQQVRE